MTSWTFYLSFSLFFAGITAYIFAVSSLLWLGDRWILRTQSGIEPALNVGLTSSFSAPFVHVVLIVLLMFSGIMLNQLGLKLPTPDFEVYLGLYGLLLFITQSELIRQAYESRWLRSMLVSLAPTFIQVLCFAYVWLFMVQEVSVWFEK